jgi:hypothetical protein
MAAPRAFQLSFAFLLPRIRRTDRYVALSMIAGNEVTKSIVNWADDGIQKIVEIGFDIQPPTV